MYKRLQLKNFKAFRELDLALRPLTLLSGMNGMGKSSILQSLLLLRQSYLEQAQLATAGGQLPLILNGNLVELGTGRDVFFNRTDYITDDLELAFSLEDENLGNNRWQYEREATSDVLGGTTVPTAVPTSVGKSYKKTMPATPKVSENESNTSSAIYETSLFTDQFHYLQAERLGPRPAFGMSDYIVRQRRQLGKTGEYTAHFLHEWQNEPVELKQLHHKEADGPSLRAQVTAWLSEISPGTRLDIQPHNDMDLISLKYRFPGTESFRSTNVGFGITYTLPVIVALLSTQAGYLVLLENPEAHLHPRGQSMMGELMARAASAGVQVIVETHSDHIMNGIRVAARKKLIDPDSVAFHFFHRDETSSKYQDVRISTPKLDGNGRLDKWPEFFFDEWDRSLDDLM